MKRFAYFYFMKDEPEGIGRTVEAHVEHWQGSALRDYAGGPFADRSGGLVSFSAESAEQADSLVRNDPFVLADLVAEKWLKEWQVE
ncbi:MAG: YciI family protein [Planctomycetota bacterium]